MRISISRPGGVLTWAAAAVLASLTPLASSALAATTHACPTWSSSATYVGGQYVRLAGQAYRANWWTQDNPGTANGPSGSGQPWTKVAATACKDATTPVTPVTPTPAPPPASAPASAPKPTPTPTPASTPAPTPVTPTGALGLSATQGGRVYTGYYESWSSPWFDATGKTPEQVYKATSFARIPATYTHVMVAFADPNFHWSGLAANSWTGTGIGFSSTPADIKAAIQVLHQRNIKVLLAVGGATYGDWSPLAAEGAAGSGPITTALAKAMTDLGFDGLDVDYEADADVDRLANAIRAMRNAVNLAGGGRILSTATWSTGADCTAATANDAGCAGKVSYWGGNAGRERQLVSHRPDAAAALDLVNVMTYDARYEHYDAVLAYQEYRALFGAKTIVSIGLESAPEGWAGGLLVVRNGDAQCQGSRILQDQYGKNLDQPYSVERLLAGVTSYTGANRNPRDGAMLWSIQKHASGLCGAAPLASPGTIGHQVSTQLSLPDDATLSNADFR